MNALFGMFWPFDFSLSGFFFVGVMILSWFIYATTQVVSKAVDVTKDVLTSDVGKEVSRNVLTNWFASTFLRR